MIAYLLRLILGHDRGPRVLAVVNDPSMPKGCRAVMVCRRCHTCEPLDAEHGARMVALQNIFMKEMVASA